MTRRVSESEQGQLQGANNSVGAIAGVLSPLFFGAVYFISVGPEAWFPHPGAAFLIASLVLFGAATIAWRVPLRARVAARKRVVQGKSVSDLVDLGGSHVNKTKRQTH